MFIGLGAAARGEAVLRAEARLGRHDVGARGALCVQRRDGSRDGRRLAFRGVGIDQVGAAAVACAEDLHKRISVGGQDDLQFGLQGRRFLLGTDLRGLNTSPDAVQRVLEPRKRRA